MQPVTLYLDKISDSKGKYVWKKEAYQSLKRTFGELKEGKFKVFIQEVKRVSGWRYKYYFAHVLPMICEYMNRNGINTLIDPMTGDCQPIDVITLHEYHKQKFNPALIKNILKSSDSKGNVPEFIVVPMTTTKMSDGDFINRFEEEIISCYANQYNIEFLSRQEFKEYFEDGKDSKMIIDLQFEYTEMNNNLMLTTDL